MRRKGPEELPLNFTNPRLVDAVVSSNQGLTVLKAQVLIHTRLSSRGAVRRVEVIRRQTLKVEDSKPIEIPVSYDIEVVEALLPGKGSVVRLQVNSTGGALSGQLALDLGELIGGAIFLPHNDVGLAGSTIAFDM